MLWALQFADVEIHRARAAFTADGRSYPAGSHVILMAQPASAFAKTLTEIQHYPDLREYPGGPPQRPYDATAYTMPLLMGVNAVHVQRPFTADLEAVPSPIAPPAGNRHHFTLNGAPAQGGLDFLQGNGLIRQVALQQILIHFGQGLHQAGPVLLGQFLVLGGNLPFGVADALGGLVIDDGLHFDQVDEAPKLGFFPQRELQEHRVGLEALHHHLEAAVQVLRPCGPFC